MTETHAPTVTENAARPDFSVIVTCFQEESSIEEFHRRLSGVLGDLGRTFEIVYVNDGSTDRTLSLLQGIFERDPLVTRLVDLARNFGQINAQSAGMQYASGKNYIWMDSDLQIAPEDLRLLIEKFDEKFDMVGGVRAVRHDSLLRRWVSGIGNAVVSFVLGQTVHDLGAGLRVLDGDFMRQFEISPYHPMDIGAMILCVRTMAEVPISHQPRSHGGSRWTWRRMFHLYHNVVTKIIPVIYPFVVGALLVFLGALVFYFSAAWLAPDSFPLPASPALLPLLLVMHVILTLVFFLLLGEFILHNRAPHEPAYIVRRVWTHK